ncbi:protein kinase [Strigomonas culicis]|uniref:Protein kinase n=1 Tax=Strigomonas culicis TaxID=28005 RepID=S9W8T5_9TRYP|nr:protein kinase [Strigomonas culicis]|eukprot:EPY35626.1 protein kinase [Strigomonas culicis]
MLQYHEAFNTLYGILSLSGAEADSRKMLMDNETAARTRLNNQMLTRGSGRRAGSTALVSENVARESTGRRGSRSMRNSVSLIDDSEEGQLVRASRDQYAVAYPGRDTATRWSLRPVISLPREFTSDIEREFRCMNNHVMTKLTSMPHNYNGFDCNVCDRGILKITSDAPAFRCYKCDYDLCMKCAFTGRFKEVNFVCVTCTKKFTTAAKLQAHSLVCRGPSCSPSPRSSSRMNTMVWEESKRPSLLEVQLPDSDEPKPRSSRQSGRATYMRTSEGGRISVGEKQVAEPEKVGAQLQQHTNANFPDLRSPSGRPRGRPRRSTSSDSYSFDLPPQVQVPERKARSNIQPRNSAELKEVLQHGSAPKGQYPEPSAYGPADPPKLNDRGEIIGIAARRRAQSVEVTEAGMITIRADVADKPGEVFRQGAVPRSNSSTRGMDAAAAAQKRPRPEDTVSIPLSPQQRQQMAGAPPQPTRGPAKPAPRTAFPTAAAMPPKNFATMRPSRYSMPNPMPSGSGRSVTPARAQHPLTHSGGAFLALPRDEHHRQQFLDDFLSGGWVRFYSFTNEDTVVMYYCLQPGRYGAMFPTEAGVGTAVLDVYSKLVLYVPCMNNESTSRNQPHPHVQTFYDEEARILTIAEAQRYLGGVLKCITAFVGEISRLKAEGLTPAAVHAAHIHQRNTNSVPRDTKFVYIRKVFPDPAGSFTLFRLSNLRSQVVCSAMVDIRWQSDRRHNVGQKYYVHADGSAEPFVVDQTGILTQVETVLSNSFRR